MNGHAKTNADLIKENALLKKEIQMLEHMASDLRKAESRREAALKQLQTSEEKFRKSFHTNQDSININRLADGTFVSINEGFTELMGYTEKEIIGRSSAELNIWVNPEDRNRLVEALKKDGRVKNLEAYFRRKDGRIGYGIMSASVIDLDDVPHILSVTRDITDQKQAEDKLRKSEQHFRAVTESSSDMLFIVDDMGTITYVSPSVERFLGFAPRELIGKSGFDLILPDEMNKAMEDFAAALLTKDVPIPNVFHIMHKNGTQRMVEGIGKNLMHDPAVAGFVMNIRDVTDRMKAKESLHQSNKELAALNQLARTVASQLSLEDACRAAVQQVIETIEPDTALLFMREGSSLRLMASGPDPKIHPLGGMPLHRFGECLCGLAVKTKQPIYVTDILKDERCTWTECNNAGLSSFGAIPLCLGDESIGLLGVGSVTERDFGLVARYLETAADQMAISLHNNQLLEDTRAYAARLQQVIAERDTTQYALKKREEELTNANFMLRNVLHTIPDRVFWKDKNGRYLGCNTLFARDAGYERPEDIVGKNDYDMAWRTRAQSYHIQEKDIMESGQAKLNYEESVMQADGKLVFFRFSKIPLLNRSGKVTGILCTYSDITKNKQAEDAIMESEKKYRALFENSAESIMIISEQVIVDCNEKTVALHQRTREELLGRSPWDFSPLYQPDGQLSKVKATEKMSATLEGHPQSFQWKHQHKDGTEFDVEVNLTRVFIKGKSIIQASIRDITSRISLENQLRQSQKMEAVGQLAGGVAHDFNNMLQAILGYTSIVLHALAPNDKNRPKLVEVQKAGERAAALTRQLLAFSRRQVLQLTPVNLNQVIEDLMKMVHRLIAENIDLVILPSLDLQTVSADRGQIEQVLLNLCVNARDAMPEGGRLIIETRNILFDAQDCAQHTWAKEGRYVMLGVKDTGIGMDAETKGKIFEPFFTTKNADKGTGLGLATVYGIIRQHGGMIQINSEPGKGSQFNIYLPAIEKVETVILQEPEGPIPVGHETILLAEDNEQIRLLALEILEKAGYRIIVAVDGEEALMQYQNHSQDIDLLLLDVVMPKKGGRSVFDEICAAHTTVKCLFMSGYSENAVYTNFIADQKHRLIQKPFKASELLRAVRQAIDGS